MNEFVKQIRGDLSDFQVSIQRLSSGIKGTASLWQDSKYSGLVEEISQIADESRLVLIAGDKSCEAIENFFKIASEEY